MVSFRATDLTADVLEGQIDRVKAEITTGDTIVSENRLTTGSMNANGVKVNGVLWSIHRLDVTAIPTGTEIHITTKTLDYSGAGTALWSYKATNSAADAGISTGEYVHPTAAEEVTLKTVKPDGGNYLFVCVSTEAYTEGYRPSVLIVKPINEEVGALKNDFNSHAEDDSIHVTEANKSAWNEKVDKTFLYNVVNAATSSVGNYAKAHIENNDVHVTSAQKTTWDSKADSAALEEATEEHDIKQQLVVRNTVGGNQNVILTYYDWVSDDGADIKFEITKAFE